jgi:hypothetical protein
MDRSTQALTKLNDAAPGTQKIDPTQVQNTVTRKAYEKWNRLRGQRRFPSRQDALPRELSSLLRNIALIRVIEGGAEFEFRITGDAIVQSQAGLQSGMTTADLDKIYPGHGSILHRVYRDVCLTRAPQAYRGFCRCGNEECSLYHESLMLPLGADDGVVDHILFVAVHASNAGAMLH